MPNNSSTIQFTLPASLRQKLLERARDGESLGQTAKRLVIGAIENGEGEGEGEGEGDRSSPLAPRLEAIEKTIDIFAPHIEEIHRTLFPVEIPPGDHPLARLDRLEKAIDQLLAAGTGEGERGATASPDDRPSPSPVTRPRREPLSKRDERGRFKKLLP